MPHHSGAELPGAQALRQMAAQSDLSLIHI